MTRRRTVTGGGTEVEVPPDRLVGWIGRFGARNGGLAGLSTDGTIVQIIGGDGTLARIEVPFGPMAVGAQCRSKGPGGAGSSPCGEQCRSKGPGGVGSSPCGAGSSSCGEQCRSKGPGGVGSSPCGEQCEPIEALLVHLAGLGTLGVILVRAGAHSVGIARDGVVLRSATDRAHLQGRTAAGGWSQQRFARRRGNQRTASLADAADTAARMLVPETDNLGGLVIGGDRRALAEVLADPRLSALTALPSRTFTDIPEPRRAVLDEVAARSLRVPIVIEPATP